MARTVKCPGCGADLTVKEDNRDFMFCEYCGTKVRLDDYQETHRYVNEAEVRKVEAAKEIQLKKMEMEEQKRKDNESFIKKLPELLAATAFVFGICLFILILSRLGIIG